MSRRFLAFVFGRARQLGGDEAGDYAPTGWKPFGARTYPVQGHRFGLDLSDLERRALGAFLETL